MHQKNLCLIITFEVIWTIGLIYGRGCDIGDKCDECTLKYVENDLCIIGSENAYEILRCNFLTSYIEPNEHSFLSCDKSGRLQVELCATVNDIPMVFLHGKCVEVYRQRSKRQLSATAGSSRVGESCQFNTDCLQPDMYCSAGLCDCTSNAIARNEYCYRKVEPGQSGCTYQEQCTSVWPGTSCSLKSGGIGQCLCSNQDGALSGKAVFKPMKTRDGWVCVQTRDDGGTPIPAADGLAACPLPDIALSAIYRKNLQGYVGTASMTCDPSLASSGTTVGQDCIGQVDGANVNVGDIYDCVGMTSGSAKGVCCPSRAFTCAMPLLGGAGSTANSRFWYNSVSGTCQQFSWNSGEQITLENTNSNNFGSQEQCENYCKNTCGRASPKYSTSSSELRNQPLTSCDTTSDGCGSNYDCTTIGSYDLCCAQASWICTPAGGRIYNPSRSAPDLGWTPQTIPEVQRYFFNSGTGSCEQFLYKGQGGNFNNFGSSNDCVNYCSSQLCSYGRPLKLTDGNNQRCSSDSDCPTTYQCNTNTGGNIAVCCPRQQQVCSQNKQVGVCSAWNRRYWHNPTTRECEQFDFSGCGGNDNNFETLLDCQTFCRDTTSEPQCIQGVAYKDSFGKFYRCSAGVTLSGTSCPANYDCYFDGYMWGCCPTKSYTCALSSSVGRQCGPVVGRWYYDATNQRCEPLQFKGCDGNSNNFATRQLCDSYCGVGGCSNGGSAYKETQTGMTRVCAASTPCPAGFDCESVNVGGAAINYCCPTKATICSLPPMQSTSCANTNVERYYFNLVSKTCTTFNFQGCDTNGNNFGTLAQCQNFCTSAACMAGEIVLLNPNNQQAVSCNQQLANSCPKGYECRFDSLTSKSVCCGATDMGVCPTGEKAFLDALTMTVRECLPNIAGSCTGAYQCRFNNQKNKYYCCAAANGKFCPTGKSVYKEPVSRNSRKCTITTAFNACPSGYSCQSAVSNAFQGYCCSNEAICPNNVEFDTNTAGNALQCTLGSSIATCRSGYRCQTVQSGTTTGFCCKGGGGSAVNGGCPPNKFVYMVSNQIVSCNPFNSPSPCPKSKGYSCQWSKENNRYQCCGDAPIDPTVPTTPSPQTNDGCPNAQIAYKDQGSTSPRTCTINSNTCPTGYFCQFSPGNNRFQCCGVSAGCPSGRVAFIAVTGQPQQCTLGQVGQCRTGFSCQTASTSQNICCTGGSVVITCPPGQVRINNVCMAQVLPGQVCQMTQQCTGGSNCASGICRCPIGQQVVNNFCQVIPVTTPPSVITCPIVGQQPYRESGTNQIRFCTPNMPGNCPMNYNCQYAAIGRTNVCCGSPVVTTDVCPMGLSPVLDNGTPRICTGNTFACQGGSSCLYSDTQRQYYCCQTGTTPGPGPGTNGCPRGTALIYPPTGTPVVCNPTPNNCPPNYQCLQSTTGLGLYQCCSTTFTARRLASETLSNNTGAANLAKLRSSCKSFEVLVTRKHNGKVLSRRCENRIGATSTIFKPRQYLF